MFFSNKSLEQFIEKTYQILEKNRDILPEKLNRAIPLMIAENWLILYQTIEGIDLVCRRLSRRIKRRNHLILAQNKLRQSYEEMESDFLIFFPELINYVETNRTYF